MEENKNPLGLDTDDRQNMQAVMEDLIDNVVTFNSKGGFTKDEEFVTLALTLDNASFIVSGIMYKHGMELCAGMHDDDEEDGVE